MQQIMNKNTDFKNWNPSAARKKSITHDTILSIVILIAIIVIAGTDWIERQHIINTAAHQIEERDQLIDNLENIIDQIYMQHSSANRNTLI